MTIIFATGQDYEKERIKNLCLWTEKNVDWSTPNLCTIMLL